MSANAAPSLQDTHERILQAASDRFTQYGYNKTTMAEIASDCQMSAANLYRYFENKLAIGEALACICLDEKFALMKAIVDQTERPAAERLQALVMQVLDYTHGQWVSTSHLNELVNAVCAECMGVVNHYKQREHGLLMALLQQGMDSGEFARVDPEQTATAIATVLVPFSHPLLMPLYPLDVFKHRAEAVGALITQGLVNPLKQ